MSKLFGTARALKCVTGGRVISLAELRTERPQQNRGSGFAVLPPLITGTVLERLLSDTVRICAPADGVVTAAENFITLRTGDGVMLSVCVGAEVQLHCAVGEKVRGGGLLCTLPRERLLRNGMNGAVVVTFSDTDAITELHVISGSRRAGIRTAFYHIRPSSSR